MRSGGGTARDQRGDDGKCKQFVWATWRLYCLSGRLLPRAIMIYLSRSLCVCRRDTFMSSRRLLAQLLAVKISANITIARGYRTFPPVYYNLVSKYFC